VERFTLVNPQRWFSKTVGLVFVVSPWLTALFLVLRKDLDSDQLEADLFILAIWEVICVGAIWLNRRQVTSPSKNYLELSHGEILVAWGGAKKVLRRADVDAFVTQAGHSGLEGLFRGLRWAPTAEHVELLLTRPVWFTFITLGGHSRTTSESVEVEDLGRLRCSLIAWLAPTSPP
jgi:hypothetical protein